MERRKRKPGYRKFKNRRDDSKINELIKKIQNELDGSIVPITLSELNSFERKLVHRHFDHDPNIVTKTYRHGDIHELKIYPVGNLRKYAREKADQAIEQGETVVLPHMSSYERFIIHDVLKDNELITSESHGEGQERHVQIKPDLFGRGLKKIFKKIKLL